MRLINVLKVVIKTASNLKIFNPFIVHLVFPLKPQNRDIIVIYQKKLMDSYISSKIYWFVLKSLSCILHFPPFITDFKEKANLFNLF